MEDGCGDRRPSGGPSIVVTKHAAFGTAWRFTPSNVGKDWWVETTASSSTGIAKVEAREDAGAWIALPETSWSSNAKSMHVEDGHRIELGATSSTGATATSAVDPWT